MFLFCDYVCSGQLSLSFSGRKNKRAGKASKGSKFPVTRPELGCSVHLMSLGGWGFGTIKSMFGDVLSFCHSQFRPVVFGVTAQISLFTLKSVPILGDQFYVCLYLESKGRRGGTRPRATSLKGVSTVPRDGHVMLSWSYLNCDGQPF